MKRLMALLLAVTVALTAAACGGKDTPQTTAPVTTQPATEATTLAPETTAPTTEPPTEAPTEPAGFANPLNGEKSDDPWQGRVFAVSLHNGQYGQPCWGIGQADVLMEMLTDGENTRFLGLFTDIRAVEALGSVASARPELVDLVRAYDGIYVHASGSRQAYDRMDETDADHLDGITDDSHIFYRDEDRQDAGYHRDYNLFVRGTELFARAREQEMDLTREESVDFGHRFTVHSAITEGRAAENITLQFRSGGKTTEFSYDGELACYRVGQFAQEMVDGITEQPVLFQNVLILEVAATSAGEVLQMQLTGHGHGWFASGGMMIPINWVRETGDEPFRLTTGNNEPLVLAVGHTYLALVPAGSPVRFE